MDDTIRNHDRVIYNMQDGQKLECEITALTSYQNQSRVNLKVIATGEIKNGMSLSRCTKLGAAIASEEQPVEETIGIDEIEYTGQSFSFKGVKLPIRKPHPMTQHLIPKKDKDAYIIESAREEDFEDIMDSVGNFENILLQGEPGCGKSEFVLWLAAQTNTPLVQIQGDGEMSVVDMVGGFQFNEEKKGTYWVDGIIPFAIRHKCWVLFDEINMTLPEVLSRLHSIMDDRRHLDLKEINEIVKRTNETVLFGTMNPSDDGRHVGTKPLSPALWSRFNLVISMDFLSPDVEKQLIVDRTGVSDKDAATMLQIAKEARKGFKNNEVSEVVDTRMLLNWGRKTKRFGLKRGLRNTVLSRLTDDSVNVLRGVLMSYGVIDPEDKRNKNK